MSPFHIYDNGTYSLCESLMYTNIFRCFTWISLKNIWIVIYFRYCWRHIILSFFSTFFAESTWFILSQIWWKDGQRANEDPIKTWCRSTSFNLRELVVLGSSLCSLSASSYKYSFLLELKKKKKNCSLFTNFVSPFLLTTPSKPSGRADTNYCRFWSGIHLGGWHMPSFFLFIYIFLFRVLKPL